VTDGTIEPPSIGRPTRTFWALAVAIAVLGLAVVGVFAFWALSSNGDPGIADTLLFEFDPADDAAAPADPAAAAAVLQARLDGTGAVVRVDGARIAVDIPVAIAANRDAIKSLAEPVGRVALVPLGGHAATEGEAIAPDEFPELIGGELISAAPSTSQVAGMTLLLTLDPSAAPLFADFTRKHVGEYVALTLDNRVLSAPVIMDPIPGGEVEIQTGSRDGFGASDLDRLVRIINAGSLPAALREVGG
jgi:preprotein translocase subunit SecD